MNKWQFNKQILENSIKCGQKFLLDENLSQRDRIAITSDIKRFQRFLDGDFKSYRRKRNLNFQNTKKNILSNMKKYHKLFNKDLRSWFIQLAQSKIFECLEEIPTFTLPIDEAAYETLINYKESAPIFYKCAKELLSKRKPFLIQEATTSSTSFCFYSDILNLPFIVINQNDEANSLNHELEHGIEYIMNIPTHELYSEFGPIYFEILFNDRLYQKYGKKTLSSTVNRIQETNDFLNILLVYLYAMSIFEHYNFNIDDESFIEIFKDATGLDSENLLAFLNDEIVNIEISETLNYLLSFLKVIEVRDYTIRKDNEGIAMFNNILFNKNFVFNTPQDNFEPYIRFIEETKQKIK